MAFQELKCAICNGSGVVTGGLCQKCRGAGFGIFWHGQLLYWGKTIDRERILLEKVTNVVSRLLVVIFLIFGLFGLGFLIWSIRFSSAEIFTLTFWKTPSLPKLIFWLSVLGDLYLVYYFERESQIRKSILSLKPVKTAQLSAGAQFESVKKKNQLDVSLFFNHEAMEIIKQAYILAARLAQEEVLPAHLFASLTSSAKIRTLLVRLGFNLKTLEEKVSRALTLPAKSPSLPLLSQKSKKIFIESFLSAVQFKHQQVDAVDLFLPVIQSDQVLQEILFDLGADKQKLENAARWLQINNELRRRYLTFRKAVLRRPKGAMNRAMTALETRMLDRFSDDLTRLAGLGYAEMCVNREKEFEEIFRALESDRRGIILVGERGVGKDAILEGLAWKMIEEDVPPLLRDKRLVSLSLPKLIAGATPSEAAERLLLCLYDVARAGNIILVISDIHNMAGVSEGGLDLSEVIVNEMNKGYFLLIASTNPQDYKQIERTDLANALIKIEINEPDINQAVQILESKTGLIEHQTGVYFSYGALEKTAILSDRLMHDRFLPQKAIEILKESAQYVKTKRGDGTIVGEEDVARIVSEKTKVPVTAVTESEAEKLLRLESLLHERIIGQEEAVKVVSAALRRARAEMREAKRPIANFLFLGPTGVGKTETAKAVAEIYFGAEERMIRLDMSEYQDKSSIYRLIGAPGETGGLLTEPVRQNPFSLLLLDEIEKAHPDILNIFLQVMDDGRITDSSGRVIDFTNVILIGTSNAGTSYIQEAIKQNKAIEEIKQDLIERELKSFFRPEFLNRFDAAVVFKPLIQEEIFRIAKLILKQIAKQLEAKGIFFKVTDEAVAELAQAGFDPLFGARPLRRVIQDRVQDALANLLLKQKLGRRDVVILEKGGVLRVEKAKKI